MTAKRTQRVRDRGSLSTAVLERAWTRLRALIPGLPPAVLLPLDASSRKRRRGHFAASTWRTRAAASASEIAISPELFATPAQLLATMVHEAAHALLHATDGENPRHRGGVSRDRYGYYHRKEFRDTCRRLGLACEYLNGRYGWTVTSWPRGEVPARYRPVLRLLERSLPWGGGRGPGGVAISGRPLPAAGHVRLVCACAPPRAIRVSRSQAARGGFACLLCHAPFQKV